jgi:hypothetical protein
LACGPVIAAGVKVHASNSVELSCNYSEGMNWHRAELMKGKR